jgi:hypothetical protein
MHIFLHPLPVVGIIGLFCAIIFDAVLVEIVNMSRVSARYKAFEFEEALDNEPPVLADLEETAELA